MIIERKKAENGFCPNFPYGYVECRNGFDCMRCTFGDRVRKDVVKRIADVPLFSYRDVRNYTVRQKGADWWHYPIILSSETLEALELEKNIYYQLAVADSGSGVFHKNPMGYIDIYLYANPQKRFTITRNQALGIPNCAAVRRYDELFFWDLAGHIDKLDSARGVWHL